MNYEKGQIVIAEIPAEEETSKKYMLISAKHDLLPLVSGYVINPLQEQPKVTDVPLVPNAENNIRVDFSVDMSREFIVDSNKAYSVFGHLKDSEQSIIDSYESIFAENSLTKIEGVDKLSEILHNQYLLLSAVKADDDEAVKEMLGNNVNIDEYKMKTSLLHYAVKCNALKASDVILAAGEYIDVLDSEEKTPLCHAVEDNNKDIALFLLNNGADSSLRVNGRSIFEIAKTEKIRKVLLSRKKEKKENEVLVMIKKEERAMSR